MPSHRQIAKDWGVARSYVDRCVKRGCPTDTFENARLWRSAHTSQRTPTDPKSLARLVDEERDDDSPEAREHRKTYLKERANGTTLPEKNLENALYASIEASDEATRLLREAMVEGKISRIQPLLSIHSKAIEARIKTDAAIREEMERRRILVTVSESQTLFRRLIEIVVSRLTAMPQNIAARCNPSSPDHALEILQQECTSIIADAQKAMAR
jgi:hypothetical protein